MNRTPKPDEVEEGGRSSASAVDPTLPEKPKPPRKPGDSFIDVFGDSIIGQATVFLTILGIAVYVTGAVSMGLKLWFLHFPWTPVLSQIPRDFIVSISAGQVLLPSLAVGLVAGLVIDAFSISTKGGNLSSRKYWSRPYWVHILSAAAVGAIFFYIPFRRYMVTRSKLAPHALRPVWEVAICCLIFALIAPQIAMFFLRKNYTTSFLRRSDLLRKAWTVALATLAIVPCLVCLSGALLLSHVKLCGPSFAFFGKGIAHQSHMEGTLIGTTDSRAYVAVFNKSNATGEVKGGFIAVVPMSSVDLEAIGQSYETTCQQLSRQSVR